MQYPIIDLITDAYINNGWTGLDIPQTITYEPIQLGSGDPSPTNVRPILPATILNIGGNDVPVYGGSLDVTTGVLTVDRARVEMGTLTWIYYPTYAFFNSSSISDKKYGLRNIISDLFKTMAISWSGTPEENAMCGNPSNSLVYVQCLISNLSDFMTLINGHQLVYELNTPITYQLTQTELENAIGIKNDIAHRLKLPLPHYFPHPVIDALQRAAAGNQTADDTEILRHYLTPLGIGGI